MRKLARFAAAFAIAAALGCYLLPLSALVPLGIACGVGAAAALLPRSRAGRRAAPVCLGLCAGLLWFWGWTALFLGPMGALAGESAQVEAVVSGYPVETAYGVRVEVRLERNVGALLYADRSCAGLEPGDRLAFSARLQRADRVGEEETLYFSAQGIFLLAYADGEIRLQRPERPPVWTLPVRWSAALRAAAGEVLPGDAAGLIQSVVLGGREGLSEADREALSRAGLAHVASVSGMLVGILSQGLLLFFRKRRRLAAGLAIPALAAYALLVGAGPGVVRAVVMQSVLLLAPALGREEDGPTSLGLALLVLLAANPYAAASVGLQLSFASVAGIMLVSGALRARLARLEPGEGRGLPACLARRAARSAASCAAVSLGAMLFSTPLAAYYFRSVSLVGVLSGLLVLWTLPYLFLLGLPAMAVGGALPGLGRLLGLGAALPARWMLWVARGLGGLSFAALPMDSPYYRVWLGAVYVLVCAALLFHRQRTRPVLPLCAPVGLLLAAVAFTRLTYAAGPLTVSALDVGQGSATALVSRGATALVDCGGNGPRSAGDVAADYFQAMGISTLDLLVLTHFDSDHFNGVEELFARMEVAAVAIPDVDDPNGRQAALLTWAAAEGSEVFCIAELAQAQLGAAVLTLYPPLGSGSPNEEGLMALCSAGEFDVLITGDADAAVESMLVKYFAVPDIELLIVGHHGSRYSTGEAFLAAVRPEQAVISTGRNTYGHPSPETLARLEAAGVEVYRTDELGTVSISIREEG